MSWFPFPPPPGEREPGEGERCLEEGGEEAERGGQVPVVRAEQPRASVHGPDAPEPRTPVLSSPRWLPPAHRPTTLPALTCQTTEEPPLSRWRKAADLNKERLTPGVSPKVHVTGLT